MTVIHFQDTASSVICRARGLFAPLPGDITVDRMRVTCPDCKANRRQPVWLRRMQEGKLPNKDLTEAGR